MIRIIILICSIILTTISYSYAYTGNAYIMIAPKQVEFSITNPQGLITGYTKNGILNQIVEMPYYIIQGTTRPEPESERGPYEIYHIIKADKSYAQITEGNYQLTVYGSNIPLTSLLSIEFSWGNSIDKSATYINEHLVYPNAIWVYEFNIPAIMPANGQIVLTKVSTPTDLIKDITIAGQLGYIGNTKFVSELTKEINEIEAEKVKGKVDDGLTPAQKAKKEYTELLSEITEKYNKPEGDEFVKKEAYDVLREDLEYIIGHL